MPGGGNSWTATERLDTSLSISAFGEDEAGELLVAHLASGSAGAVYRLVNPLPPPPIRTLTVVRDGTGGGTVTSTPAGITCGATCTAGYPEGTTVALSAVADAGSFFAGFAGSPDCVDGRVTLTADQLCSATFLQGSPAPVPPPTAGGAGVVDYLPRGFDLNGDGRGDVLLYRPLAGGAASLLEDGSAARPAESVERVLDESTTHDWSPGWAIKPGDFDGDGRTDLFFYDAVTGAWFKGISTTPPNGPVSYSFTGGTWSPGWSVAVLELNGDGRADVFLYNVDSGAWYRGVSEGDGTGDFGFTGGIWSPGWQIHPVRLDGDGLTDLFLYNVTTGSWYRAINDGMNGFAFVAGAWSPGWQVNPGDFDGDGLVDLFLYDVTTGAWYVAVNTGGGWSFVGGTFSPGWTVRTGDFDGDGRADLFLYDVLTGSWYQSLADGAGGWTHLSGSWSPGWEIHVTHVDLDARADLLLYNPVSGDYFQAISTGPGAFAYVGGTWGSGYRVVASSP